MNLEVSPVLTAVAPVFLLIVFGTAARRLRWPGESFWPAAEKLTYYALFPALLFRSLALAPLDGMPGGAMAAVLVAAALAMTVLVMTLRPLMRVGGAAVSSLLQGSIRFNTYLGVAVTAALFGDGGIALAAIYLAIMVPLGNVVAVGGLAVLAAPGGGETAEAATRRAMIRRAALETARNPLILACLAGLAVNVAGVGLFSWIDALLEIVGRAALPLGLLCVGAGLDIRAARAAIGTVALACGLKLIVMPALTYAATLVFGLTGLAATIVILFNALPAAPTSYVLARQMGGDAELMAGILTAQTALAVITLPLLLSWMG